MPLPARPPDTPTDAVPVLLAFLTELQAQVEAERVAATRERQQLLLRIQDLEQQLHQLRRRTGPSVPAPDAPSLFPELVALPPLPAAASTPSASPRRKDDAPAPRRHRPLDPALPRDVIRVPDPPVELRVCPESGLPLVPGPIDVLEILARRTRFVVKRYERTLWVSPRKTAPLATPWPREVWARMHLDASVVAYLATARFALHLPYDRLTHELARHGIHLSRSSQVDVMAELERRLTPVAQAIRAAVLASGYVHLDATPLDCLDRTRPGKAQTVHVWAYRARSRDPAVHDLVWYDFQLTKTPKEPAKRLARYHGIVQTDGASGLDALGPPERITHLACWAHARRYFVDAVESDARAAQYLALIDRLFKYQRWTRAILARTPADARATVEPRLAMWRERFSLPLADRLCTEAATAYPHLPPKSALAGALAYLLGQRASLRRCLTTPGGVLDNNSAENAIRPLKLGARNWLFLGHPNVGPRYANLITVIENVREAKLNIEAYLTDLLTRFDGTAATAATWLPRAWQRARSDGIST